MKLSKTQPRWKKPQNKKKQKENKVRLGLGIVFIGFILSLVLAGFLWKKARNSIWDGKSRLAVVEQNREGLRTILILPEQDRLLQINIPVDLVVQVPFDYGQYQVSKVFELGQLEQVGGKLLTQTVQDLLGVETAGFKVGAQTNLTWLDKLRWYYQVWFSIEKRIDFDLANTSGVLKVTLRDGNQAYEAREVLIDEMINLELFDQRVVKEGLSLSVVNATGVNGVASKIARILTNLGGEVSLITNQDNQLDRSKVVVKDKDLIKTETVKGVTRLLDVDRVEVGQTGEFRAEVVVVIGKDYVKIQ